MRLGFNPEVKVQSGALNFTMRVHSDDELLSNIIRDKGRYSTADQQVFFQLLKPGGTFVDIGANIGWYSLVAGTVLGPSGRILAIEPEPRNLELLKINLDRGCRTPYSILPIAIGEQESTASLFLSPDNFGDHSLLQNGYKASTREKVEVPVRRLDQVLTPEEFLKVDLLKMDTQGYEPRILSGLRLLLQVHRPPLMIEFSPMHIYECNSSPFEIYSFLENNGYLPLRIDDDARPPQSPVRPISIDELFMETKRLRQANYGIDLLLLPMEHPLVAR